ncbi:NAD(P)H nitroreductase [Shewanella sp. OPT22]|uniref:NAD(P)H nitroreductase n=1 Tax=Parashewanella hymeniacidonis TaxID=2807618 RepID=UPI00101F03CA|nr:NAD(P)H nitroreductase [Parashewanella hymeniacidonis]MBM7072396.1 NAD(P)H nitroreductase [Parashewanella hymeniacidonis]RYV02810.1 NAD(P)H nitroreductase [Shewanella sp. OPT22]
MEAKELLLTRHSSPRLIEPGPTKDQLEFILDAGVRVPDHASLTPWEFIVIEGEGTKKFSDILVKAAKRNDAHRQALDKAAMMPFRAPTIIAIVATYKPHAKVPKLEQAISAGCAVMAMQQACFTLGLGSIWRTGEYAYNTTVKREMAINDNDEIVGFLYIGMPPSPVPEKAAKKGEDFTRYL